MQIEIEQLCEMTTHRLAGAVMAVNAARSLFAGAEQLHQEGEQVDEVQVERQRAHRSVVSPSIAHTSSSRPAPTLETPFYINVAACHSCETIRDGFPKKITASLKELRW